MERIARSLFLLSLGILSSGCVVIRWTMTGMDRYQQGRRAAELSNEEIRATAVIELQTALPLTQQAAKGTLVASPTVIPGATSLPTPIQSPAPTPVPIFWVKPKIDSSSGGTWYRFFDNPGLVGTPSPSGQRGGYYPGMSIWDSGTPTAPGGVAGIRQLGVIGAYFPENALISPVVETASGDEFRKIIITAYMELSDFNAELYSAPGVLHDWGGHGSETHPHLWLIPTSDRDFVVGFLEPTIVVGDHLKILQITQDGRWAKVQILNVWMDKDDTVVVEAP